MQLLFNDMKQLVEYIFLIIEAKIGYRRSSLITIKLNLGLKTKILRTLPNLSFIPIVRIEMTNELLKAAFILLVYGECFM